MNDPIYSDPNLFRLHEQRTGWSIVLIFTCIALGFTASAADYERVVAGSERNHAQVLATECSTAEGQLEDLGKFLADPNTRLIPLTRSSGYGASPAVIAWNTARRNGYFLCDDLPVLDAGRGYELWAMHGMDDPMKVAALDAKPGDSVYPFRIWPEILTWEAPAPGMSGQGMSGEMPGQGISVKMRLEITAGPRSVEKKPIFAGEID